MASTHTTKRRGAAGPNGATITDTIVFPNHIDWRTMDDPTGPRPIMGKWAFSLWQRALRDVVAARHGVTVGTDAGDFQYRRGATLTGTRPAINETLAEYTVTMASILAANRKSYLRAANAERNGDDATVAAMNPDYIGSWETYYNAFGIGAVAAYAAMHGVTVAIPSPRHTATATIGAAMYPPMVATVARKRSPRRKPATVAPEPEPATVA